MLSNRKITLQNKTQRAITVITYKNTTHLKSFLTEIRTKNR